MKHRLISVALLSGLFLSSSCLVGCGKHGTGNVGVPSVHPSKVVLQRNVDLTTVQQRALVYRVETIGVLEAEGQTDIAAGVNGVVDQVFFREGDDLPAGSLLVTIDQERYQADEDLARGNMDRARENMNLMRDLAFRAERAGAGISAEDRAKAIGGYRSAEAEYRAAVAGHAKARNNLERSRVRTPYDGRINKRMITKGSYLEEKTVIATIADLSRIRLVGYVPESAAPVLRDMLATQDDRLLASRAGLMLNSLTAQTPWQQLAPMTVLASDMASSGYDPEFEVFALPGQVYLARIFYMSTVGNMDTHMFECKAEVLGWRYHPTSAELERKIPDEKKLKAKEPIVPVSGQVEKKTAPSLLMPGVQPRRSLELFHMPKLWPGFTAKIRFPMRSSPNATVIPEEAVRHTEKGVIVFVPEQHTRDDGKTEWVARVRVLDLGFRGEGWVEVRRGLRVGEQIVHRGAEALEDGTPIRFGGPK